MHVFHITFPQKKGPGKANDTLLLVIKTCIVSPPPPHDMKRIKRKVARSHNNLERSENDLQIKNFEEKTIAL